MSEPVKMEEYLKIDEVAARLRISPRTVKNRMALGVFKKGVHYFRPPGMSARFKWSAVVRWIEQDEKKEPDGDDNSIPMARGYHLRKINGGLDTQR